MPARITLSFMCIGAVGFHNAEHHARSEMMTACMMPHITSDLHPISNLDRYKFLKYYHRNNYRVQVSVLRNIQILIIRSSSEFALLCICSRLAAGNHCTRRPKSQRSEHVRGMMGDCFLSPHTALRHENWTSSHTVAGRRCVGICRNNGTGKSGQRSDRICSGMYLSTTAPQRYKWHRT